MHAATLNHSASTRQATFGAVLLAAGSGSRMAGAVDDKILMSLGDQPVFAHSLNTLLASQLIRQVAIVYRDSEQRRALEHIIQQHAVDPTATFCWTQGGKERQHSVLHGLQCLEGCDYVFIHDCARPLITVDNVTQLAATATAQGAAVLAHPARDSVKMVPINASAGASVLLDDLDRSRLWIMETPQVFRWQEIRLAYQKVNLDSPQTVTDDVGAARISNIPVALVANTTANPKLTTADDIPYLQHLIQLRQSP